VAPESPVTPATKGTRIDNTVLERAGDAPYEPRAQAISHRCGIALAQRLSPSSLPPDLAWDSDKILLQFGFKQYFYLPGNKPASKIRVLIMARKSPAATWRDPQCLHDKKADSRLVCPQETAAFTSWNVQAQSGNRWPVTMIGKTAAPGKSESRFRLGLL